MITIMSERATENSKMEKKKQEKKNHYVKTSRS